MKKIRITTPENIEVEYTLADVGSRTAAAAIDMLIQSAILLLLGIAVFLILYFSEEFWDQYYGWIIGGALLLYGIISYGYFIFMELTMNGKTIGKRALNLRVIRNNGQSLSLKHSAIRNLFRVFIDVFGIGVVFIFFSKERKRLGDFAASTIVVREDNKETPITLEELQGGNMDLSRYLSKEEIGLLREYYARKNSMKNPSVMGQELKNYFMEKFEPEEMDKERYEFIDQL